MLSTLPVNRETGNAPERAFFLNSNMDKRQLKIEKWFRDNVQVVFGAWSEKELKRTIEFYGITLSFDSHSAYIRKKNGDTIAVSPLSDFEA